MKLRETKAQNKGKNYHMSERFHVLSNCLESKVVFWVTYSVELSRHVPFVAAIVVAHLEMRLFPGFLDPIAYQTLKL